MHTHIIPRRFKDLTNSDDIYTLLESEAGDLGKLFHQRDQSRSRPSTPNKIPKEMDNEIVITGGADPAVSQAAQCAVTPYTLSERPKFPIPLPDELRKPRTVEDMEKEAKLLAKFMAEFENGAKL